MGCAWIPITRPVVFSVFPAFTHSARCISRRYTAVLVKHERHGISERYAVKALALVFDRDIPVLLLFFEP